MEQCTFDFAATSRALDKRIEFHGSFGGDAVSRAVASNTRDPQFESSQFHFLSTVLAGITIFQKE